MSASLLRALAAVARLLALPLRGLVFVYQRLVSPLLPGACRYHPTCSAYAAEALALHGAFRGSWLALLRIGRCHPFAPGGLDPVPLPEVAPPAAAPLPSHSSRRA